MTSSASGASDPLYDAAYAAYRRGERGEAARTLRELLVRRPAEVSALILLGVVSEDKTIGRALLERAASLEPSNATAWYNLGVQAGERGDLREALDCYRRTVALEPQHGDALLNGSEVLRRQEFFEESLAWAERRLAMGFDDWSSHLNKGVCLYHLRRFAEAEACYDRARERAPDRPIVLWERFALMLHQNRFAEAWDAFEHRFAVGHLNGVFHFPFPQPLWTGQPLADKHLIVHNEQGLGDQLMFACALDEVAAQARRTTVVVAPTLVDLFQASFPGAKVLPARFGAFAGDHPEPPWLAHLPRADYQVPIGSLMAIRRRTAESFAPARAYLRPSEPARARWRAFDAGPGLKVGLCWASNPALFRSDSARRAVHKSMALDDLAPLAEVPDVSLVSVLNWPVDPVPAAFDGRLKDVSDRLISMDETAALIERLDVVVTVDTSVAHLAGAMGKETWVLLHAFPDARWELEARTSYWYPNMRLFRQARMDDWTPVVAEVAEALRQRAGAAS